MTGQVFFSIGLKAVAYDHHLIAEARYVFQVPFTAADAPIILASVCRRGRLVGYLQFRVWYVSFAA
jgi:ammonia channel protein AmtB